MTEQSVNSLSAKASDYALAWRLSNCVHLAQTPMGLVQRVTQADGSFAVLKTLSNTGRLEEGMAPEVLDAFAGSGAVHILKSDSGAQLIEHCNGPRLLDLEDGHKDDVAMPILADVVARLHQHPKNRPSALPTLADRCRVLDRILPGASGASSGLLSKAKQVAQALLADEKPTVLHGDLHHGNILRCDRAGKPIWLAIDPQGVWGDQAYELANLFGNPIDYPETSLAKDRPRKLASRLERALNIPARRLLGWAFVHSCISAAWAVEDNDDPGYRLQVAELIEATLQQ